MTNQNAVCCSDAIFCSVCNAETDGKRVNCYILIVKSVNTWRSCIWTADNQDVSDHHSYEHYLSSNENKAWQKFRLKQGPLWCRCSVLPTQLSSVEHSFIHHSWVYYESTKWLVSSSFVRLSWGLDFCTSLNINKVLKNNNNYFLRLYFHFCWSNVHNYADHLSFFNRSPWSKLLLNIAMVQNSKVDSLNKIYLLT